MTSDQILTIGLAAGPTMLTVLITLLINHSRLSDLGSRLDRMELGFNSRLERVEKGFSSRVDRVEQGLHARIDDLREHMDTRFDDQRAMWQGDLRRVEEVLGARLKHLEER